MSDQRTPKAKPRRWARLFRRPVRRGQALVEYVLIMALVTLALIAVLAITGPAVGNVFSNQVYNLLGGTIEPRDTLEAVEFWTQVAAVASYTPENPSLITNTPVAATSTATGAPTMTPSPITPSPLPTDTATPGPSPTPPDQNFGYPFNDKGDNDDWWQHDFNGPMDGDWNAEFFNMSGSDGVSYDSDMSAYPRNSGDWTTTFPAQFDEYWGDSPGGGVTKSFYARFDNTMTLFVGEEYTIRLRKDDGARLWVWPASDPEPTSTGDALLDQWSWQPKRDNWFTAKFTPTASEYKIKIEMFDNGWGARAGFEISSNGLQDKGDCEWGTVSDVYRSPNNSWHDSPSGDYAPRSYCILRLRGYIDLRGSVNPKIEFWDRYDFYGGTEGLVGISIAGTGNWVDIDMHRGETNLGWTRQSFDLTNFGDPDGSGPLVGTDFSNELIEVRFVLDAEDSSGSKDGWWIDDIEVKEEYIKRYTVGFADDMEGELHWYAGGTWARTNENPHSGTTVWSDSPGGDYTHGSNSTLELDGIIDLNNAAVVDPEVVFWHRYNLTWNDVIYIEVSNNNRESWINLTGTYDKKSDGLAYRDTNWSWTQTIISLADYIGQEIYLRFRIDARNSSHTADGWWIDDFALRNAPEGVIRPNWCDGMEDGGSEWIADGTWSVVVGSDYNPSQPYNQTIAAHDNSQMFWSDSPGANYADDTNSALTLNAKLDMTSNLFPQMVFWHQWDLANSEDLYVEVSQDDGSTWTPIWTYQYNNLPEGYRFVPNHKYNTVLSWTREVIDLSAYAGTVIRVRFRLDATYSSSVDDGWWLDDICFVEYNEPVRRVPFEDNLELQGGNWHIGGDWTVSNENTHDGLLAFSDSHGRDYTHESNGIVELKGIFDLDGTVEPTLYYWESFFLQYEDYALVEVNLSEDGGSTWTGWDTIDQHRYDDVSSWNRRQIDLRPYIPDADNDRLIKLRFRLYAARDARVDKGWWIDDIAIIDRDGMEPVFPLPFIEDGEVSNDFWVKDGTWGRVPALRELGSGADLGPGGWTADYFYKYPQSGCSRPDLTAATHWTTVVGESSIDYNWGTGGPAPNGITIKDATGDSGANNDCFMVRWTRTIEVSSDGTPYQIEARSDDGIRIAIDPPTAPTGNYVNDWTWVLDEWRDRGPTTDNVDIVLDEGTHTIVIEYYENGGGAVAEVSFIVSGMVFHDSPAGDYFHDNNMSLTLEGVIDLSGTSNPALSYWDKRQLGSGDTAYTEISTDGGFTWDVLRQTGGTDSNWRKRLLDLSSYAGEQVNIRFRLDARNNSRVGDGWWIDDILVAE